MQLQPDALIVELEAQDEELKRLRAALIEVRRLLMDDTKDPLFAIEDALVPLDHALDQ